MWEINLERETSRTFPLHLLPCYTHFHLPFVSESWGSPLGLGAAGQISLADGYLLLQRLPALPQLCPQSQALEHFQEGFSYPNKCLEKSPKELQWGLCSNRPIQGGTAAA